MIFATLELRTYAADDPDIATSQGLVHPSLCGVRRLVVRRRRGWLPPDRFRETLAETTELRAWRDYVLDVQASADRGVIVYRQITASQPKEQA